MNKVIAHYRQQRLKLDIQNPIPGYVMIHSLPSPLFSQVFLDFTLEYRLLIETHLSDSPVKVNHSVVAVCNFIILTFLI